MIKKKQCFWIVAAISLIIFFKIDVCQALSQDSTELARVNERVITRGELNKKLEESSKTFQLQSPTKKTMLDDLIKRELGIQEALRQRLDHDPEVIDRMNTVLYHALLEKNLAQDFEKIHTTDDEAQAYYSKNPDIRTSQIFVALRPHLTPEEQKQAYERIKKIKDTYLTQEKMSFAEAAQRFSEGTTAPMGGDMGYQPKYQLDAHYYQIALKLSTPGKVSDIIKTPFGYHIIKLTAIRPWEETDRTQVKRMIFEEQRTALFEKFMNKLKRQAQVSVKQELIKD